MGNDKFYEQQRERLATVDAATEPIAACKAYLLNYQPFADYADDIYAWLTCSLALEGVVTGNFGVGAILLDDRGQVVAQGHNEVFHPHFRSDRHAEMVVIDGWEN